jgi:hypothetical protein
VKEKNYNFVLNVIVEFPEILIQDTISSGGFCRYPNERYSPIQVCINCISSHWVLLFLLSSRHPLNSKPRALETHLHFSPMLRCFQFLESADVPKKCKSLGRSLIFFLPVLNAFPDEDADECGHEQNLPCFFCVIYLQPCSPYLRLFFFGRQINTRRHY